LAIKVQTHLKKSEAPRVAGLAGFWPDYFFLAGVGGQWQSAQVFVFPQISQGP